MLLLIQSDIRSLLSDNVAESAMVHILISRVCCLSYTECTAVTRSGVTVVMGRIYQLYTTNLFQIRTKLSSPRLTLFGTENVCERPAAGANVGRP